jgi:hypothetical protein
MPPAKVYRIDQLKPKGYLSQIEDDLSEEEQALLARQKEASRQLFNLLLAAEEQADEVTSRRRIRDERLLRQQVSELSRAVERMFAARGRQVYFDITGYTEKTLLQEARGQRAPGHARLCCYLCEPMRTLGWSRRRALGEACLSLYLRLHGPKLGGDLLGGIEERWEEGELGPFAVGKLAGPGFYLLVETVRDSVKTLGQDVLQPHLASWQHSAAATRALSAGDHHLVAESIARLLLRNTVTG